MWWQTEGTSEMSVKIPCGLSHSAFTANIKQSPLKSAAVKGGATGEAVEGFQKGTMASRKEQEEMLELLDSARYSHKNHRKSCEATMVQKSHRTGMVSESGHKTAICPQFTKCMKFLQIKVLHLQIGTPVFGSGAPSKFWVTEIKEYAYFSFPDY